MNEGFENNLTHLYNNWTFYNSSLESTIPRNNITYVGFYLHPPSTAAIFIMSYLLIFLVCMVGNGVVCFIVLRSKNMRTVTNLFILNLAVSDLLVGIFCMPTTLLDNIITGVRRGRRIAPTSRSGRRLPRASMAHRPMSPSYHHPTRNPQRQLNRERGEYSDSDDDFEQFGFRWWITTCVLSVVLCVFVSVICVGLWCLSGLPCGHGTGPNSTYHQKSLDNGTTRSWPNVGYDGGWPFGSLVCKMSGMVQGISVSASVFTLVAIAVDRFRCIVYPFKQKLTISTATLIIVIIWVLAISIMCPSGVMLQVTKEQTIRVLLGYDNRTSPFYWCRENWPNQEMRKIYTTVLFANIYLAPLSLIVIMYARIGITLFKTAVPTGGKPAHDNRHTVSKKKQRVIKMLLIVALLFILSWLPLWTLMMLSDYASLTEQQYRIINIYIYPFAHWLAFFNSSINPIIYGFFNENFRRGFQSVFKFSLCTANRQRRKTYSHRLQGNSVLPANNAQTSLEPISLNSLDKNTSRGLNHVTEHDLVMEDLEKGSCSSGGVTVVSI